MLFNSIHFAFFFVVVTTLYFILPHKYRWILLLSSSCYFYMAFVPIYILILGFTIVIDYFAGIYIENAEGSRRKLFLIFSLIANIGVLAVFKYYNFLNQNFSFLLHGFGLQNPIPYLSILLPIGLSFHTFQAMSYTIEVYRGHQSAERHFGIYSLYVMFYPQLVAGPIERPQNLLHQFREKHVFDYDRVTSGLRLMAWGLFKKVVIADRLAIIVDAIYDNPEHLTYNSLSLIIGTVFFAFQIFCDFSGYSDMAIGAARIMGFKLMTNFDKPYQSKSIHEFWKRWHISLSSWFKDYLYITLGGNRVTVPRWYLNLFIVFLVSGLWHGANWTFVIWGALHGFYLVFAIITKKHREKINKLFLFDKIPLLSSLTTFVLVAFAWIFFRANNVHSAINIIKNIFIGIPDLIKKFLNHQSIFEYFEKKDLVMSVLLILFLETVHYIQSKKSISEILLQKPTYIRWAVYYGLIITIIYLGVFQNRQFIYFQF
ncbi:MAG: MBOAT family protein [Bacteroidetes bacterium]|nr:MBOAT family protein [Bacteroidota bacterium]